MTIIRATHHGLCFGVRDAIALAQRQTESSVQPIHVIGQMAHNPRVRETLRRAGADELAAEQAMELPPGSRVMISAHGTSQRMRQRLEAQGLEITDATCPLVNRAHEALAALVAAGRLPVILGKPGHVEVEGLRGDYDHAVVILRPGDVEQLPPTGLVGVVAQTTQPSSHVRRLLSEIARQRPGLDVDFRDTVCRPTRERQEALLQLCRDCDVVIVVGGRNSNNTRELCRSAETHGVLAYHVESATEVQPRWFEHAERVGLTAGTSTPEEQIVEIEKRLRHIAASKQRHMLTGFAH